MTALATGESIANKWLFLPPKHQRLQRQPDEIKMRLFCFPHAGAGAYHFHPFERELPRRVELLPIEYPGHNSRRKEPPFTSMQALVAALAEELAPLLREKPFALLGHSMGAWVAAALTLELQTRGGPLPLKLYASGNRSPALAGAGHDVSGVRMHVLPPAAFWAEFERRYGPNPALEPSGVRDLMYPVLRADFAVVETYRPPRPLRLPCPVAALGGEADPRFSREQLEAWRQCAPPGHYQQQWFSGGHFYLLRPDEGQPALLAWLGGDLAALATAAADGSAARALQDMAAAAEAEAAAGAPVAAEAEPAQQQQEQQRQEPEGGKASATSAVSPPAQAGEMRRGGGGVLVGGADVTEERVEEGSGWCRMRWLWCC